MDAATHFDLDKRYVCGYNQYYSNGRCYYYSNSRWSSWGRWVLLGVVIVVALAAAFLCM